VLHERDSEVTSPERRAFIAVLAVMSLLFIAAESPFFGEQPGYVLVARIVMSALLVAAPPLLGRALAPRAVRAVVYVLCAGVCLSFATIAWGTGGTASPYYALTPMLPLIFTIAVPDLPLGSLVAGLCAGGMGLARAWMEGMRGPSLAFWVLAFTTTTIYAVIGSIFSRRQRARERRLVAERLRAEELAAESERQRARAERLALLGRLAEGVAHDVASPLARLESGVRHLELDVGAAAGLDGDLPDRFAAVRGAAERIRRIVDDLRTFAAEDGEGSADCDLAVVAEEARQVLAERFRAAVAVERAPTDLPRVHAVRARLVQALVWIMVDASGRGVRTLHLGARCDGTDVVMELADDGADLRVAGLELPAAAVREAGLALALAREELTRAGCEVEEAVPGAELRLPLRVRCQGGAAGAAAGSPAARVA
jgi:signal transduction histidine kinase